MRTLVAALAVFLSLPAIAQELPSLRSGTPYVAARQQLIRQGWKPVTVPGSDACSSGDERCQGRPEMVSCSGTGMAACSFAWRRSRVLVHVFTQGEVAPVVSGVERRGGEQPRWTGAGAWERHPQLSWPATPLSVVGSDGSTENAGEVVGFFREIASMGFRCDARDSQGSREVTVSCQRSGAAPRQLVYKGSFVGAGYLVLERADIDGRRLGERETGRHVRQVLDGKGLT